MKVREKLMRKVMAVVIAVATIFSISGGTKVVPVKAAGEVAEIVDLNGNLRGQYVSSPIRCKNSARWRAAAYKKSIWCC